MVLPQSLTRDSLNRIVLKGVNDFATTHPRLARELHPSSARRQPATTFNAADTKPRVWLCAAGHDFKASARDRANGTHTCKECKKRRTRGSGRSLTDTHPDLAATWLPELNAGREPADYTKGSRLEVVWWCEDGGHPFTMRIEARTRGCGCPYCAGRLLLPGFNDFASTHPDLAVDWHPYLNWRNPSEVMAGSTEQFVWRCKNGHEMTRTIPNRRASHGCTACSPEDRAGHARRGTQDIQHSVTRRRTRKPVSHRKDSHHERTQ